MRTGRSNYPNNSNVTIPRRRRRQVSNISPEPEIPNYCLHLWQNCTMEELLLPLREVREKLVFYQKSIRSFGLRSTLLQIGSSKPILTVRESENPHAQINTNASRRMITSSKTDERIDKLADQLSTLVEIVSKKVVTPAPVKAVEESCVTCGGAHSWNGETEETTDKEQTNFQGSTAQIPPPVIPISIPELDVPKTLPKTTPIPESDIPEEST
ncbi:hypothetical protein Tco_0716127 [Tanacetum coccineum]